MTVVAAMTAVTEARTLSVTPAVADVGWAEALSLKVGPTLLAVAIAPLSWAWAVVP